MPRYSDDLISEIFASNDIIEYVSRYVNLKKTGRDYMGLCPFHNEKSPSFHVSQDRQLFHCFGCGASGNLVQFVMRTEGLDFLDALKVLADRAGITLPEDDGTYDDERHKLKQKILEMNRLTARFYYKNLVQSPQGAEAREYFAKRKITGKTITAYGLGYAPPGYTNLMAFLKEKGFSEEDMLTAGLLVERDGRRYDKFRDRVMFPVIDVRSNVIGFGGRIMREPAGDIKLPKYLNSPQTPVFDKGSNLFSLNFAKKSDTRKLILCEGYMDVISVYQAGVINIVATLGTAITENQAKLMLRYADEILICYDSDEAGQKATLRAIEIINKAGGKSRVIRLKGAKDPDEYIKANGVQRFQKALQESLPSTEYRLMLVKKQYDLSTTDGKISFIADAAGVLTGVRDAVEVDAYVRSVAEETQISPDAIYAEYKRRLKNTQDRQKQFDQFKKQEVINHQGTGDNKSTIVADKGSIHRIKAEQRILWLCAVDRKMYEQAKDALKPENYSVGAYQKLARLIYDCRKEGKEPDFTLMMNEFSDEQEQKLAAQVLYNMEIYHDRQEVMDELLAAVKLDDIEKEIQESLKNSDVLRLTELQKQKTKLQSKAKQVGGN